MSFKREKLKIMIRKNVMRISPSMRLNATEGRTGCRYVRTLDHAFEYHTSFSGSGAGAAVLVAGAAVLVAAAGAVAQPAPIKSAFVNNNGAATKSSTLKMRAKIIEPTAALVVPFFNSSLERFCVGTGKRPGTAPVNPAKSPSPSITAGESAILTSSACSASAKASLLKYFNALIPRPID